MIYSIQILYSLNIIHFTIKLQAPKASSRSRRLAVSSAALNVDKKNHDEGQEIKKKLDNSRKAEKGKKAFNETPKGNLVIRVSKTEKESNDFCSVSCSVFFLSITHITHDCHYYSSYIDYGECCVADRTSTAGSRDYGRRIAVAANDQ